MFCETTHFKERLNRDGSRSIAIITSEFVSCLTDDDEKIHKYLTEWRRHILSNLIDKEDLGCQLNKGNIMVLLHQENVSSFRKKLESSIICSEDNKTLMLRYRIMVLNKEKANFFLSFF